MKVTLKDLLRHKFPMDETEQAVLLKEISDLAKELRERLTQLEQGKRKTDNAVVIASRLSLTYMIKEILGES